MLSLMIAIPLIAGVLALFLNASGARWIALAATLADLGLGIGLWVNYNPAGAQWQFVEHVGLGGSVAWALGIDGIALMLIMLSVFLMPICIGASWRAIDKRVPEYMSAFLLMEALMIGVSVRRTCCSSTSFSRAASFRCI